MTRSSGRAPCQAMPMPNTCSSKAVTRRPIGSSLASGTAVLTVPITLIHGSLPRLAIAASRTEAHQRHLAHGREVVEEARLTLSSMVDPSIQVHAEAVPKTGVDALLQESRTAATLILQRRNLSALGRAFNSATSHTVAAQAACPVIAVRHDQLGSDTSRGVVVGIGPHSGGRALQVGVLEAAVRRCPLTAVYVWDLPFRPRTAAGLTLMRKSLQRPPAGPIRSWPAPSSTWRNFILTWSSTPAP